MIIMAVDNHYQRLGRLVGCLRKAYPDDEIVDFADPFRAVQYSVSHYVDVVFTDDELKPFNYLKFAEMVTHYCEGAKVYAVTNSEVDLRPPDIDEPLSELLTQATSKGGLRQITAYANGGVIDKHIDYGY